MQRERDREREGKRERDRQTDREGKRENGKATEKKIMAGYLIGFYGISTILGYLMPNPFLYKLSVLFQTIQFSICIQFNCQNHFYFKLLNSSNSNNSN